MPKLDRLSEAAWFFISSIYKFRWNLLYTDKENKMFR